MGELEEIGNFTVLYGDLPDRWSCACGSVPQTEPYSGGKQGKIRRYALRAERAFYCLNRLGMVCSSIIIIYVNIQKIVIQVMTNMHKIYRQISSQTLTKKYDIDII